MKIVLLGAGNVATHIGIALKETNAQLLQVYSRSFESAKTLGEKLAVDYCCNVDELNKTADVYLYAVKDDTLSELIKQTKILNGVHVHTAGSVKMDVFNGYVKNYGVLYPLQTFSKDKSVRFSEVPLFIESNNSFANEMIVRVAHMLSALVYENIDSEKRKILHLSAVFACNFTNYMYVVADELLQTIKLDYNVLLPLIKETTNKLNYLSPREAQTGPAARKDEKTIKKHIEWLQNNHDAKNMYELISKNIERNIN